MARRIRTHDWAATPLGPIHTWPQALTTTIGVLLVLREPAALAWGPDLVILYNDAYVDLFGGRDQVAALGVGVPLARPELWTAIGPDFEQVLRGGPPVRHENRLVPVLRHGRLEDILWTYSFNPVPDANAAHGVGGVLIVAEERVETTAVMRESDEQQLFLSRLTDALRPLGDPGSIEQTLTRLVGERLQADWVTYGQIDEERDIVDIGRGYARNAEPPITGPQPLSAFGWAVSIYKTGATLVVSDTQNSDQVPIADRAAIAGLGMVALLSVPLLKDGELVGALAVSQLTPRTWTPAEIRLAEYSAERIWAAMQRAHAEARMHESEARLSADLAGMRRLYELHTRLSGSPDFGAAMDEVLDAAVAFTNTDRGTIQLVSTDGAGMEIVRERGYPPGSAFVEHFRTDGFAAGRDAARTQRQRLIIEDAANFPGLIGTADGAATAASGVRAAQSTPMISRSGEMIGVLSTQFRQPHRPTDDELRLIDLLAWTTAEYISRHRADQALRESEQRFRLMADAVPQIVWITDAGGRMEFFNRQWRDYTGIADLPATAIDVADPAVHPDDEQLTMAAFGEALRTGTTFEVEHRIRSKSGEYRWFIVRAEPSRDPLTGKITRWFGASVDIEQRKQAETALRDSEERFRTIVERARDYAIFTTDVEGRIDTWPPGAQAVFGWSAEEAIGQPVEMTFTPEDRANGVPAGERKTAVVDGHAQNMRWHLRKDGSRVFIEGSMRPLNGDGGPVRGFLKIGQDVTASRRVAEHQAVLLAELQHRVRNILATIRSIVRRTGDGSETVEDYAAHLSGRIDALARTQVLLTRSAGASIDLELLIQEELLAQVANDEQYSAEGPRVDLAPKAAEVVTLAIHELATNSTKYGALSRPDGHIVVSWSVQSRDGAPWVKLDWTETGIDVTPAPVRKGFGTELIESRVPYELRGTGTFELRPEGLHSRIEFPLVPGQSILQTDAATVSRAGAQEHSDAL